MKENLKKIKTFTETGPIEITDIDNTPLDEYSKKLSELLQSSNVSILQTSSGCLIIRPSRIDSILVTEEKRVKEIKKSTPPKQEVPEDEERLEED